MSSPESPNLISNTSFDIRKNLIRGKEDIFGIEWTYKGSAKQNERLRIALQDEKLRKLLLAELSPTIQARWNLMREVASTSTNKPPKRWFLNWLSGIFGRGAKVATGWLKEGAKVIEKSTDLLPWTSLKKVYSAPYEHSGTSPLCSRTAAKNFDRLWIDAPTGNAKAVHDSYGMRRGMVGPHLTTSEFSPPYNANVADIWFKTKNPHWHRVAMYIMNEEWHVLDPYYMQRSTAPVPASQYFNMMRSKWYSIGGAAYYHKNPPELSYDRHNVA